MCGLFASIGFDPDRSRLDIVTHRGPDDSGWEVLDSRAGPVVLGHRRLAIIDLTEGGHQPMLTPDARYAMVYNGEIYNYIELRNELRSRGEVFHTVLGRSFESSTLYCSHWIGGCHVWFGNRERSLQSRRCRWIAIRAL